MPGGFDSGFDAGFGSPGGIAAEVDWLGTGYFEGLNTDLISADTSRGRDYASQLTGRSSAGQCSLVLRNIDGKYSSFNTASPLFGLIKPRRRVRISFESSVIWAGFLDRIEPQTGSLPTATLYAYGALATLAGPNAKVNPPAMQDLFTGEVIEEVLDAAGWPAGDRDIDLGEVQTGHVYWEEVEALTAIREMEDTEQGFVFEDLDWGIGYRKRDDRLINDTVSAATLSDEIAASLHYLTAEQSDPLREIFNEVVIEVQPHVVGELDVLWTLTGETLTLPAGESRQYIATTNAAYVQSWTTPVVGTDIVQTGVANGDIGVAVTKTARTMFITVTNNHGSAAAVFTLIQARGVPVTRPDSYKVSAADATSQAEYLKRSYPFPSNWYANAASAQASADYIVYRHKDPRPLLSVAFTAFNAALLSEAVTRDLSDRVTVVATELHTMLGIDQDFHIEAIRHHYSVPGLLETSFDLSPAADGLGGASLFQLDVSVVGGAHVLAY